MSRTFKSALSTCQAQIETELDRVLPPARGGQAKVQDAMRYAALGGGKRLRPFLLLESVRLFRDLRPEDWQAACALECVHVYSLVHDDLPCMDDDDLRRGKPTVHKAFNEALAVLAGDALLTQAFEILGSMDAEDEIKIKLISGLAKASGTLGMIGGQVIDISVEEHSRDEALITELQALKTGALISYAVEAGALLGHAVPDQRENLAAYARDLGLMFQITDDILDVEGDADLMGKATRKDENLGKATFVSILGLEGAKEKARKLGIRAKSRLEGFGKRANILLETVDFVLERRN